MLHFGGPCPRNAKSKSRDYPFTNRSPASQREASSLAVAGHRCLIGTDLLARLGRTGRGGLRSVVRLDRAAIAPVSESEVDSNRRRILLVLDPDRRIYRHGGKTLVA